MPNEARRIHVEGKSLEQLKKERAELIDDHLQELGKHCSIENQDLDLVMREALRNGIPESLAEKKLLLDEAVTMAGMLSDHKLKRLNNGVKGICKLFNVGDLPDHIVWSARRAGVELLDPADSLAGTPEAPEAPEAN